jgi:serine/threonine-protein kinase
MYELLTGHLPFIASTAADLARMHRELSPVPPRQFNPDIPPALEQILLKVLSKESSARYRTADQLGRVLMTIRGDNPAVSRTGPFRPAAAPPAISPVEAHPAPEKPKSHPIRVPPRPVKNPPQLRSQDHEEDNPLAIDWGTIALGLLALLAVGGLIPFWIWVYFVYNPPFR